jgi:diacylglycerol kinase family enzyme
MTAGVGIDAKVLSDIRPALKKLLGRNVYPFTTIQTLLTYKPSKLKVWLDSKKDPHEGYFVVIGNIKHYGRGLEIAAYAKPDDGHLDVCIFKHADLINLFKCFLSATSNGDHPLPELEGIEYFKAKKLKVKSRKRVLAHTDAEIIGSTPVSIKTCARAIRVIC